MPRKASRRNSRKRSRRRSRRSQYRGSQQLVWPTYYVKDGPRRTNYYKNFETVGKLLQHKTFKGLTDGDGIPHDPTRLFRSDNNFEARKELTRLVKQSGGITLVKLYKDDPQSIYFKKTDTMDAIYSTDLGDVWEKTRITVSDTDIRVDRYFIQLNEPLAYDLHLEQEMKDQMKNSQYHCSSRDMNGDGDVDIREGETSFSVQFLFSSKYKYDFITYPRRDVDSAEPNKHTNGHVSVKIPHEDSILRNHRVITTDTWDLISPLLEHVRNDPWENIIVLEGLEETKIPSVML